MKESLDAYREEFKLAVLNHISECLPPNEWSRLRSMATNRARFVDPKETPNLQATPEELLEASLSEDSISVEETLAQSFSIDAVEIARIQDKPVHYVQGQGMYIWGLHPENGYTLSFWATYPAYPPSW